MFQFRVCGRIIDVYILGLVQSKRLVARESNWKVEILCYSYVSYCLENRRAVLTFC